MRFVRVAALCAALALAAMGQGKLTPLNEAGYQKLLAASRGRIVLVDFWATWCKPCRAEMPRLVALESKLRSRGFQLITVSADEPEQEAAAQKFLSDFRVPGTAYVRHASDDDKFINSVDQKWSGELPALFLYDKSGRKVKSFLGETPIAEIESAVGKLF